MKNFPEHWWECVFLKVTSKRCSPSNLTHIFCSCPTKMWFSTYSCQAIIDATHFQTLPLHPAKNNLFLVKGRHYAFFAKPSHLMTTQLRPKPLRFAQWHKFWWQDAIERSIADRCQRQQFAVEFWFNLIAKFTSLPMQYFFCSTPWHSHVSSNTECITSCAVIAHCACLVSSETRLKHPKTFN